MPSTTLDSDILAKAELKKVLNKNYMGGDGLLERKEFQGKAENQRRK